MVTLAAHAPAYAASTTAPTVSGTAAYTVCKQPGGPNGPNCQGYRMSLTFTVDAPDTWTVTFTSAKVNGTQFIASIDPNPHVFTVSSANPTVNFTICTAASPSQFDFDLTYTVERPGVAPVSVIAPTASITGIKNC